MVDRLTSMVWLRAPAELTSYTDTEPDPCTTFSEYVMERLVGGTTLKAPREGANAKLCGMDTVGLAVGAREGLPGTTVGEVVGALDVHAVCEHVTKHAVSKDPGPGNTRKRTASKKGK